MATYGHTFTSGDTLTPTKLNNARTVTDIVNADISASAAIAGTKLADEAVTNSKVAADAAIGHSKLANITAGRVLLGNASNVPTATALAGDVTINSSGTTAIASNVIVNADINSSAAIAGTKVSPNFGSQNVVTTGSVGAGTASPSEKLHVVGDSLLNGFITSVPTYDLTTTSGANMAIFSAGTMRRSTSSLRYKQNIEDADGALSENIVLNARPVWFRSKCDGDNPDWSWWGFIAEEIAEIDSRLVHWGTNEDGGLRPDGVQYDRFVPHLCAMIQKQQAQISELLAKVAALEAA
jgi:hypothetical protein